MALDETKETDTKYEFGGFEYIVNTEFLEKATPIKVDFKDIGFSISSNIQLTPASDCGSCGSTCS